MKVSFNNCHFILNKDGSIYWIKNKILILGDLHLEKGSSYASDGNFLPPYDTLDTLIKLTKTLKKYKSIKKIILLGDIFHDANGYYRLNVNEKMIFDHICKKYNIIWIYGNHDESFAPKNVDAFNIYLLNGINFTHIPSNNDMIEISGHYHPKASFKYLGRKITKSCFVIGNNKIIIPAYGSYAGGLNIYSEIYKKYFKNYFNVYAVGSSQIIKII